MPASLSTKTKLAIFLVPGISALVFLLWWLQPERVIMRRFDAFLEVIDVSLLRTETNTQHEELLQALLAEEVEFFAPDPIPDGPRTPADVAKSVRRLHESVASCKIQHTEPSIHFPNPREGRLETNLQAIISGAGGTKTTRRYRGEFLYIKGPEGWKIQRIGLKEL